MELIFKYPAHYIVYSALLGLLYSLVLYYKSVNFIDKTTSFDYSKKIMFFLRFLSVSLISFLLLAPLIKTRYIDKIQPIIILAQDNSSSIKINLKNLDQTTYINSIHNLKKSLFKKYDVDFLSFSNKINSDTIIDFEDTKTNISNTLEEVKGNYYNKNVGAFILATDGIYNEGHNPIYTSFDFPIYIIALGDTNNQKDLKISSIKANKIAYINDKLKIHVNIESNNFKDESVNINLYKKTKDKKLLLKTKKIQLVKNYTEDNVSFIINTNKKGIQNYKVEITRLKDEITIENNERDFFVDIIDSRQKILLLANAPHPDIAVLKQTVALNKNLEIDIQYIKNFSKELEKYNLIILHQLPSSNHSTKNIFSKLKDERLPYLIITGTNTDYQQLNTHQKIVNILPSADNFNEVTTVYNQDFNLFTLDKNIVQKMNKFPPVSVPFGDYKLSSNSNSLFFQKIGAVETTYPILSFNESFDLKSAIFIGEGLWKWKMYDFLENKNHDSFNEIFSKTINYLTLKSDKRKFRVHNEKNIYLEGEPVQIVAELYNKSYELINTPEVLLIVKNEKNEEFPLVFNRTNNAYSIKTNNLPTGEYVYTAKTNYSDKKYIANGAFIIKSIQVEALQTKANHKMLYKLAKKTGGKVFYSNELEKLQEEILSKEDIKTTLYESFKTQSIINLKWIFFLILSFLSLEWFARKFFGSY